MKEHDKAFQPLISFSRPYTIPKQQKFRKLLLQIKGQQRDQEICSHLAINGAVKRP